MINKQTLVTKIIELLAQEVESLAHAAKTAHNDATNTESKAEHKYDTRGLEASYLAGAQAKMAASALQNLTAYRMLELKNFSSSSVIALTAFIELADEDDKRSFYFLGPAGGGTVIEHEGMRVLVITPSSPLGRELLGREVGDCINGPGTTQKTYEIISLY